MRAKPDASESGHRGRERRPLPAGLQVAPSLLAADFANLGAEIRSVEEAGAALLHLDVMDGHFVPNITFGPPLVAAVRRATKLFLDAHLMIASPERYVEAFVASGVDLLTLHVEALGPEPGARPTPAALAAGRAAIEQLHRLGCGAGLTFRPATDPLPWVRALGAELDLVLVMTVEPGFGGQAFRWEQLARLGSLGTLRAEHGWAYRLEVDGGIDPRTAPEARAAGAEILVAGTSVYGSGDPRAAFEALLDAVR